MTSGAKPGEDAAKNDPAQPLKLYPANYDGMHRTESRADGARRELVLSPADYERFRLFVLERMGFDFEHGKQKSLSRGLAEVMDATGCTSLDQLYSRLQSSSSSSPIWDSLISALTVGETYFFRNTSHFDVLAKNILPALIAQREHSNRRIRFWSAGSATGEEAYSVAILIRELVPHLESWNISILATDINREALRKAKAGLYGAWSFRGVEKRIQDAYFHLNVNRQFALADEIKRMVTFEYLNLVQDSYPSLTNNTNAMDVILCRNVTIYFTPQVTQRVLGNFYNCLTEDGWLIPGAAEPNMVFYGEFCARNYPGAVVYQKPVSRSAKPQAKMPLVSPPTVVFLPDPMPVPIPAKPVVTVAQKQTPPPDPFVVALALMQSGQTDDAIVKLYEKLDQVPNFAPTYYTLGKIYANKGNLEEAQAWCERALKIDKLHPEPYYTLSMIYQQNGLLDMALDVLKKAIYLDRAFVLAHYNLAQICLAQGDLIQARKSLHNVRQLLGGKPREELVPEGDGLVVGRLLELVDTQLATEM